ncbi:Mitochondrial inner membrane protein oxa1 [Podila humilis]|nr:Mitochondrial inner membrane protein oxa1 [Podila humilis]
MSDHSQLLHDPAVETHLDDANLEDSAASSAILLERADYDESGHSPDMNSMASSSSDKDDDDHVLVESNKPSYAAVVAASNGQKEKTVVTPRSTTAAEVPGAAPVVPSNKKKAPATTALSTTTTTALGGEQQEVQDLNKTMPWKVLYPIASRETILSLLKGTAINFLLPFINGIFLGFGEICAHELAYRWGWTNSAHVVNVPGRQKQQQSPKVASVGLRSSGSGIGGLRGYDDEANKTASSTISYAY